MPHFQTSESSKSTHVRQVAPTDLKHMVQKVEMNVAMLTAGIEKRAAVRLSASHETAVVKMDITGAQPGVHPDAQDDDAPQCMETDVYTQGREPTHQGGACPIKPS